MLQKSRLDFRPNSDYNAYCLNWDEKEAVIVEKQDTQKLLIHFNSLYKKLDDVHHSLARHFGLSDCALWILYAILETNERYTQSQICEIMYLSKQTVHSALRNLESAGYIRLEPAPGNQKSKQIILTDAGNCFSKQSITPIFSMEQRAFEQFSAEEQATFFRLLEAYVKQVEKGAQTILREPFKELPDEDYND